MLTQQNQWQHDGEESEKMSDQYETLELSKQRPDSAIYGVPKQDDSPEEKRAVPILHCSAVFGVGEQNQTLNHRAGDKAARCDQSLPTRKCQPGGEVSKKLPRAWWRKHRDPMVLPTRGRCHGYQFGERCEYGQCARPDDNESVNNA